MSEQNQDKTDAPGGNDQPPQQPPAEPSKDQKPPETPPSEPTEPKVEIKDGVVLVDGKKYVKETDLIATKESLTQQLNEAQATHNEAVDKLKLQVSDAQREVAEANAALDEAKKAREAGDISAEEMTRIKEEAETAKTNLTDITAKNLELRRKLIMTTYQINPESDVGKSLEDKNEAQLDSFEEALKAVMTSRGGPGNYALGGGGAGPTKMSDMDRAGALIEATPYRGVRNAPPEKPPQQ